MKSKMDQKIKGQVLVLFAIALLALVAMAALLMDGGQTYLHRRQAQAAADAGALAGARLMCSGASDAAVLATAQSLSTQNGATTAVASFGSYAYDSETYRTINVDAAIHQRPFVGAFGVGEMDIPGSARAACFSPYSATRVMPVAWSCRPPIGGSDSPDCAQKSLNWEREMVPLLNGPTGGTVTIDGITYNTPYDFDNHFLPQLYIFMDSDKTPVDHCTSYGGTLDCDIDNDGQDDILGTGDRSWLDLTGGGGGASELRDWISGAYSGQLRIHTWIPAESGVKASTFQDVDCYIIGNGRGCTPRNPVILPVFNAVCNNNPTGNTACQNAAHTGTYGLPLLPGASDSVVSGAGHPDYYHMIGFSGMYVTCVEANGSAGGCPGKAAAVAAGLLDNSDKTIEGYFINGFPFDLDDPLPGGQRLGITFPSLVP